MVTKNINIQEIIEEYRLRIERKGIRPEKIILYGSYAAGHPHAGSDIDLVVISSDFASIHPLRRLELLSLATAGMHAPIEAIGYTPEDIKTKGQDSVFWEIIQKTGKTVYRK